LPLPPPGQPTLAVLNSDGKTVRLEGDGALRGAMVAARNEEPSTQGAGDLATADSNGHYVLPFVPVDLTVHPTNRITMWQMYGQDSSDTVYVWVPYGVPFGATSVDDAGVTTDADTGDSAE
jgi:hypothetical protein